MDVSPAVVPVLCLALTAALTGVEASVAGVVHPAINRFSAPARHS